MAGVIQPRDPFAPGSGGGGGRLSDADFADVFGGPPRRPSLHEARGRLRGRSRVDSFDPGFRPGEAPVFGDGASPGRWRHLGDDFFNDIFPGSESPTPKRVDSGTTDLSSPRSRRPSFAVESTRYMDGPASRLSSGSVMHAFDDEVIYASSLPASPNSSAYGYRARAGPFQDESGKGAFSVQRDNPFSRLNSRGAAIREADNGNKRSQPSLDSYITSKTFHYSFYKWAGKGVSLASPTSEEKTDKAFGLRGFPDVIIQGVDLLDDEDSMSSATGASKSQDYNFDRTTEKKNPTAKNTKSVLSAELEKLHKRDTAKDLGSGTSSAKDGTPDEKLKAQNFQVLQERREPHGNPAVVAETEKPNDSLNEATDVGSKRLDSLLYVEDRDQTSKTKAKVKDFVKAFNYEAPATQKAVPEVQGRRPAGKDSSKSKIQIQPNLPTSEIKADTKTAQSVSASSNKNEMEDRNAGMNAIGDAYRRIKEVTQLPGEQLKPAKENIVTTDDVPGEDHLEGCVIEEVSEDQIFTMEIYDQQDQIKISDLKIKEWSKGKEGNIRSLLSTLQNVLWPGSGWKPVPLMDIIEGPAVKKAYQKALLCLHPDKLQQRGAATHQKYLAEKVFDILQEAWTHFNSINADISL